MHGHTTVGFVQVWLEVVSIISSAYPGFGSGLTNIAKHWFLIFIFSTKPGICSGGRNSNATPAQSPNVYTILFFSIIFYNLKFLKFNFWQNGFLENLFQVTISTSSFETTFKNQMQTDIYWYLLIFTDIYVIT